MYHVESSLQEREVGNRRSYSDAAEKRGAGFSGSTGIAVLKIAFSSVNAKQAAERIDTMVESGEPHYAVTANADTLGLACRDAALRRAFLDADLIIGDGISTSLVSWFLGPFVPGGEQYLSPAARVLLLALSTGRRVLFVGAGSSRKLRELEVWCPRRAGNGVAGEYSIPVGHSLDDEYNEILRRISVTRPDILVIAYGCPDAEKWIAANYRRLGVPLTLCSHDSDSWLSDAMPAGIMRDGERVKAGRGVRADGPGAFAFGFVLSGMAGVVAA